MTEALKVRKQLAHIMEQYLEGIIEKNTAYVKLAPSCKITFNGLPGKFGDNILWRNTLTIRKRQTFFDGESGGIVFFGVTSNEVLERTEFFATEEQSAFVSYAVVIRLKVVDGQITEIEELAWSDRYKYFYCLPEDIPIPDPFFDNAVPEAERMTRDELIEVAESYWQGAFGELKPKGMMIHPDAARVENGYLVTNHSNSMRGDFKWNKVLQNGENGSQICVPEEYKSYPVVDPARGIVISFVNMTFKFDTVILRIAEAFLVREGCIKRIFAMYPRLHNDGGWMKTQ